MLQEHGMWVWNWNKHRNKINKNIININEYILDNKNR